LSPVDRRIGPSAADWPGLAGVGRTMWPRWLARWSPGEHSAKTVWRIGGTVIRQRKVELHHGLRLRPFRQPFRHVAKCSAPHPGCGRNAGANTDGPEKGSLWIQGSPSAGRTRLPAAFPLRARHVRSCEEIGDAPPRTMHPRSLRFLASQAGPRHVPLRWRMSNDLLSAARAPRAPGGRRIRWPYRRAERKATHFRAAHVADSPTVV
jgi:hypothetical protein